MLRPVEVKPLSGYRVWIKYDDGECGEIDLSDVAGQGVFKAWNEPGFFEKVHITSTDPSPGTTTSNSARCAVHELTGKSWNELPVDADGEVVVHDA